MTKLRIWGFLAVLCLLWACNFTEEIHFNEDGTGKLNIHFNGDEMMAMVASMGGDSLPNEKAIDTTLVFKELLEEKKDSIAKLAPEEQAKLKKLEPFSFHMVMDQEKGKMSFDLLSEFKKVEEVNDAFNAFQDASLLGPQAGTSGATPAMGSQEQTTKVNYMFTENSFKRTITIIDEALFKKGMDSLKSAEMFMSGSTYTFKYHFPRKVKSTNVEGATFSLDGKTMTYAVDFLQMMKDPESIVLEVELED
jgi:hypothetical protein